MALVVLATNAEMVVADDDALKVAVWLSAVAAQVQRRFSRSARSVVVMLAGFAGLLVLLARLLVVGMGAGGQGRQAEQQASGHEAAQVA